MLKIKPEKNPAELLKAALVKDEEQPYELPGNWVWVRLGSVLFLEYGKGLIKNERSGKGFPVYGSNGIVGYHLKSLINGPAIIVGRKGSIGEVNWSDDSCWPIDTTYYVITKNNINFNYLYLLLKNLDLKKLNRATAIPGLNREDVYQYKIALPPLPEQTRIVQKLTSMLGKLKQARELIQEAKDSFENRRAAILHKAFTGEITRKWREENLYTGKPVESKEKKEQHYKLPISWSWEKLSNLTKKAEQIDPKEKGIDNFIYLDISSIDNRVGIITEPKTYKGSEAPTRARQIIKTNDILFSTVRPYLKNIALVDDCYNNQIASTGFCVIRVNNNIEYKLLFYFVRSDIFIDRINQFQRGISYPAIKTSDLLNQIVPLPPINEQKEIVRILDTLLNHETEAKALIDLEDQIDLMEKSILSKAFRGELGTNDPKDEPAMELLKRTLAERVNEG